MKVKAEIILNLDTGSYEIQYFNLSQPGEPIDLTKANKLLGRVFPHVQAQAEVGAAYELNNFSVKN